MYSSDTMVLEISKFLLKVHMRYICAYDHVLAMVARSAKIFMFLSLQYVLEAFREHLRNGYFHKTNPHTLAYEELDIGVLHET